VSGLVNTLLSVPAIWVYVLVAALVFVEDALFVGFVVPGETAAILAGVDASRGHVNLVIAMVVVVLAAISGDSVGYAVGKHRGTRLLQRPFSAERTTRLDEAREFLVRRGGVAVFLGRGVAFLRAVMPALAGTAQMPYRRFLPWNALGGSAWGVATVLIGYLAGNSYAAVAHRVGQGSALVVAGVAVVALVVWRVHRRREQNSSRPSA
jgi:membrane-associated protein